MPNGILSPRLRKVLRFSMRTMIVLVLVCGGGMGWLVRSARIQHAAVAAVTSVGGNVMYDWEWNKRKAYTASTGWIPKWALDNLGTDYFHAVTSVWLYYVSTEADKVLIPVGRLTRLEWLSLIGASVTDAGLARLRGMTSLTRLRARLHPDHRRRPGQREGTDRPHRPELERHAHHRRRPAHLKTLTNLTELNLAGTPITNAGLAHLKGLKNLAVLNVVNTRITDAGVIDLKQANPNFRIYR